VYFLLYYFIFERLIRKFDFKTPGREEDDAETKLYTKADVQARERQKRQTNLSEAITAGLGGRDNIADVDCCATRLRCTVKNPEAVDDSALKATGAAGVIRKGSGVQIVYGPQVAGIKTDLQEYLKEEKST